MRLLMGTFAVQRFSISGKCAGSVVHHVRCLCSSSSVGTSSSLFTALPPMPVMTVTFNSRCFMTTGPWRQNVTITSSSGLSPLSDDPQKQRAPELEWTAEELQLKEKAIAENAWLPVYRFRLISLFWFQLRFNLVLTAGFFLSLPVYGVNERDIPYVFAFIVMLACSSFLMNSIYTRFVGVISVDKASRSIYRIGHLKFTGSRANRFVRWMDIVQPLEIRRSVPILGLVGKMDFVGKPRGDYLMLPINRTEILDREAASILLGDTIQYFDGLKPHEDETEEANGQAQRTATNDGTTKRNDFDSSHKP